MFKLFALFAFFLAVASAAPTYELYHQPTSYSYQSSYVQHPSPILKTYAHPVVVHPVEPIVKYHAAPLHPIVPIVKHVPAVYSHQYVHKAPVSPYVYAPHYY